MRGEWYTTDSGGQLVSVLGGLALVAAVAWVVITFIWVIAAAVGVVLAAAIAGLVWLARHGGELAIVSRGALPPPEAAPLPSRPSQALPAPQQLHIHFHGLDAGQAAEVVRRHAVTGRRTSS